MLSFIQFVSGGVSSILGTATQITSDVVLNILIAIFNGLPNGSGFPVAVHTGAIYLGNALHKVAFIVPTDTLIQCLLAIISLKLFLFAFHLMFLVFNWIRGVPTAQFESWTIWDEERGFVKQSRRL